MYNYVGFFAGVSDVSSVNPDRTLLDLGLDSLMGVEVKQVLESRLDTVMHMNDLQLLTFKQIADLENNGASNTTEELAPNTESREDTTKQ